MTDITWDIEASGLLDDSTIDYTTIPYKLKPSFKLHVIAVEEWDTGRILCFHNGPKFTFDGSVIAYTLDGVAKTLHDYDPVDYVHYPLDKFPAYICHMVKHKKLGRVWGHNQINYDLMAADLYFDMPFDTDKSLWCGGKTGGFEDSYVRSKVQNADRFGGHGLENVAKAAGGFQKYDFRPGMKGADKFKEFGPDMVYYNILDVKSNTSVAKYLLEEAGTWDWTAALHLERVVAEIVTRQSHRGFQFNKQQAESNLAFLDKALQERQDTINPVLPPKPSTKGYQKDFTPPKKQFKGNGDMSALMEKFIEKIGAELVTGEQLAIKYKGSTYPLPLDVEAFPAAVAGSVEASVDDSTHIKGWLVSAFDWNPTEWKERDLSLDTKRKKLSPERVAENIDRYVTQTLSSPFKKHRLEYLECTENNLREKLLRIKEGKPVRVRTNPSLTIGQEKEVDPALAELSDRFPHTQQLIEYYTFKHRRNSILGGGLEYDDEEGIQEAEKGYLAAVRADGRIPTPADTCGAASGRMKHKLVANIPRSTSLFGHEMRALFGVSPDDFVYQVGYDFASLEAGIESHYCWKYDLEDGKPYCNSLLQEKPHDVHTITATKISELINKAFPRSSAKAVKYASTYGAQAAKIAKTIGADLELGHLVFDAFWEAAKPLARLKEDLTKQWELTGKKYVVGLDGRKIPTRAAHSILNSLFQSGGVICAKRVMVEAWRIFKKKGWDVDFFREDWRMKEFVQQLIAYHDEAQAELSKTLVKWAKFDSEVEAKAFISEQKQLGVYYGQPSEKGGKFYVGYSEVTQIIWDCVNKVSGDLKLNVPLAIEFVFGLSWADCH